MDDELEREPFAIPITDVFDLHSIPPCDVEAVVEEYLSEAHRLGLTATRIVVWERNRGAAPDRAVGIGPDPVRRGLLSHDSRLGEKEPVFRKNGFCDTAGWERGAAPPGR